MIVTLISVVESIFASLTDRVAALAAPSALHPAVRSIGARVDEWAGAQGLVLGDPDASPMGRARFERLAGRILPDADEERVTLLAQWLVWLFALDDAIDDAALGGSATAVHGLYTDLLGALRRGHAKPEARPLEIALTALWRATVPGMSRDWRLRFLMHMEEHRAGCAEEAVDRRTGRTPTLQEFPALRRRAAGPFLYDLVEPMLRVELPGELVTGPAWKNLVQGTADMIVWSNDVVSYAKEATRGDVHNHVSVVCAAYGFEATQAARWVVDYIAQRAPEVQDAARALAAELERFRLVPERCREAAMVVRTLLDAPRAHLDWLAETGRYTTAVPPLIPAQPRRLDALAALR